MEKANKAWKGLKCCAEFLCGECPYAEYQHIEYKLQCIHKLHMDLVEVLEPSQVVRKPCYNKNYPDEFYCPRFGKRLGFVTQEWTKNCPKCGKTLLYTKGGMNDDILNDDLSSYS